LAHTRNEPLIRRLVGLQALGWIFFTMSIPVEVVFAQHSLHSSASGYGLLLAAWGAGGLVGSAIYARWRDLSSRYLITLGTCLLGSGFAVMAASPSLAVAIVGSAIAGVGNGIQIVAFRTALQEATPDPLMALIISLTESMFLAIPGIGILAGGAIAAFAGPRAALAAGAVGSIAIAIAMWTRLNSGETVGRGKAPLQENTPNYDESLTLGVRQP
jgi:MFS family permease